MLGSLMLAVGWIASFWLAREAALRRLIDPDLRFCVAAAATIWGSLVTLCVELLSSLNALDTRSAFVSWCLIDAALIAAVVRLSKKRGGNLRAEASEMRARIHGGFTELPAFAKGCWITVGAIAACLLLIGLSTATTNWDAHTYHLPRVLHWLQQGNVHHFVTENSRENEFGPWSGYVIAHLFLSGAGDRVAFLPQWFSMVCSLLLVSLLTESLGSEMQRRSRAPETSAAPRLANAGAIAAVFTATIPMGMLQSINPQTDYVTTFWLLCVILFGLALLARPADLAHAALCGLAFGLGLLSKTTILIYSAPLLLVGALVLGLKTASALAWARRVVMFGCCVALINAGHARRNYAAFGSPLGSREMRDLVSNRRVSSTVVMSSIVRNVLLHTNFGVGPITRASYDAAVTFHHWLRIPMDHPATTLSLGRLEFPTTLVMSEDYASAPLHVGWIAAALVLLLKRPRKHAALLVYAATIVGSVALFVSMLKFQLYHSRFHLTYLVMFSPIVAIAFASFASRAALALVATVLAYVPLCIWANEGQRIFDREFMALPRERQYLSRWAPEWTPAFEQIADEIVASSARKVWLNLGFNAFEYPLWVMLKNRGFEGTIDHCCVYSIVLELENEARGDVIITMLRDLESSITRRYPYRTAHPPLMAIWRVQPPAVQSGARRDRSHS